MGIRLFSSNRLGRFMHIFAFLLTSILIPGNLGLCYASNLSLKYDSNKLTAHVSGAPLQNVLETLSAECGMSVFLDRSIKSEKIFAEFETLPLEKAIKKLINPYNSAVVFSKRTSPTGQSEFFISELRVFDSSNAKTTYLSVGNEASEQTSRVSSPSLSNRANQHIDMTKKVVIPVPEIRTDPARMAALNKKISESVLRTRISQKRTQLHELQEKARFEEAQKRNEIQQLEQQMNIAADKEVKRIQAAISALTADLENSKIRNVEDQKRLKRELDQLQNRIAL
jgi:hypothetical protein